MQASDVIEFLNRVDEYLESNYLEDLKGEPFHLSIIGKSALLLGGMIDPVGTADVDSLRIEGHSDQVIDSKIKIALLKEFSPANRAIYNYYLEFVSESIVFFPKKPKWIPLRKKHKNLSISYLSANDVVASKCFSAFSERVREKDTQDIQKALDQKMVTGGEFLPLVDQIFETYKYDSRRDRFAKVHHYIVNEIIAKHGGSIEYDPDSDDLE